MSQPGPPDVRKSVVVPVPIERAWAIFTENPIEWWPDSHVLVKSPREKITFEPFVGGRYYERAQDGTEAQWGVMLEWSPPKRLAMTWRINGHWQMIDNDEFASEIEVDFVALTPESTEVSLAHVKLYKHGPEASVSIHKALDGPSPGETLHKLAKAVQMHLSRDKTNSLSKADLHEEIRDFYARQMRAVDNLQIEEYIQTFAEDGWIDHSHRGDKQVGHEVMRAKLNEALPRYKGVVPRHWFDHLVIDPNPDGTIGVTYISLVTLTQPDGKIVFEPTFTIEDVLVWVDGKLKTQSRYIIKDEPKA